MSHENYLQAQLDSNHERDASTAYPQLPHAVANDLSSATALPESSNDKHVQTEEAGADLEKKLEALQHAHLRLKESYSLLEAGLSSTYDGLVLLDKHGMVRLTNDSFNAMFRTSALNTGEAHINDFIAHCQSLVSHNHKFAQALQRSIRDPQNNATIEIQTYDSHWIEAHSKTHHHNNEFSGVVWSFRDITALKLKEHEAKHRTYHDSLTGLPNRRSLLSRLRKGIDYAKEHHNDLVILFIDLDGFKDVNDSLGHSAGDALLIEVSRRMEEIMPERTTLTRHGGDEFVAILNSQNDLSVAESYSQQILDSFKKPFHIGRQELFMSASIGIASMNAHGDDNDRLINAANMAMMQARKDGTNLYQIFDANATTQCEHRLRIRNEINQALDKEQFELFFQPKICLETGSIKGAEALIRWRMPDGSFRSPMEFIPVAEESGQIIPITQWVLRRCCQYLMEWESILDNDFVLALNISARHFHKGLLQEDVAKVLQEVNVVPSMLELEVTETAIMDDIELAVSTLNEVKRLGIRTAIDDFGTGYSSLNYLRKLPIEVLKIDKSFIDEILVSPEDRTLVKGIIDMVHALGIEVVAEGVENHQMAVLLQNMNCDLVQGFHYCKPIEAKEFVDLIKESLCYV